MERGFTEHYHARFIRKKKKPNKKKKKKKTTVSFFTTLVLLCVAHYSSIFPWVFTGRTPEERQEISREIPSVFGRSGSRKWQDVILCWHKGNEINLNIKRNVDAMPLMF